MPAPNETCPVCGALCKVTKHMMIGDEIRSSYEPIQSIDHSKELAEALEYCQWKLENTYEYQHGLFEKTPDGRKWHTKETYRKTEEGQQFQRAIDKSELALTNYNKSRGK